ncbi:MAG TPA: copper chaperone PCu(A)C [Nitrospiraceae bacterium]|nr:copper chaperone PCu(A)C [Nitrospiraceae bacterium]
MRFALGSVLLTITTSSGCGNAYSAETGALWKLGDIVVEQAWARVNPGSAKTAAVYLTIHNLSADNDYLVAVDSPAASATTIHESQVKNGIARMVPIPGGVEMVSHSEVIMRPGALHIMLTGISGALSPGENLPVRMIFRDAGTLEFEVPVIKIGGPDPSLKHLGHAAEPN